MSGDYGDYDPYEEKLPRCANCLESIWPHEDTVGNIDGDLCHENCPEEKDRIAS